MLEDMVNEEDVYKVVVEVDDSALDQLQRSGKLRRAGKAAGKEVGKALSAGIQEEVAGIEKHLPSILQARNIGGPTGDPTARAKISKDAALRREKAWQATLAATKKADQAEINEIEQEIKDLDDIQRLRNKVKTRYLGGEVLVGGSTGASTSKDTYKRMAEIS